MKLIINKKLLEESLLSYINESSSERRRNVPCVGLKKKKRGFSCFEELKRGKGTGNFYIANHRVRSKSVPDFNKIPIKTINFVDSAG